jgi:phosphatidate cytidylyltransferase
MKSNFWQRTVTGTLYVSTVTLAILFHQVSFFVLLFVINFLCLLEFYELVLPDKRKIEKYLGIVAGSVILLMFELIFSADLSLTWYYHIIPVFLLLFIIKLFEKTHNEFSTLAFQVLGLGYITLPFVMLGKIGYFSSLDYDGGLPLGFFILLWTSDTGAYLAGKQFGRTKLFERISPKKTVEGFVGAMILALGVAWVFSGYDFFDGVDRIDWLLIAAIVVVFGTLGDLFESLLKRNLQIKDSGTIMPGHGGVLDRFDGLFLAVPAVFFYLLFTN